MISIDKARSYGLSISLFIIGLGVVAWFYVSSIGDNSLKNAHEGNLRVIEFASLEGDDDGYIVCSPHHCPESSANVVTSLTLAYDTAFCRAFSSMLVVPSSTVILMPSSIGVTNWNGTPWSRRLYSRTLPKLVVASRSLDIPADDLNALESSL